MELLFESRNEEAIHLGFGILEYYDTMMIIEYFGWIAFRLDTVRYMLKHEYMPRGIEYK
jgi:hypothetical protein